jgi:hypothetical protein
MGDRVRIAILDAADRRMGAAAAAVFATSFPERPLEVRLFDPEPEFLDLMERLWRLLFRMEKAPHELILCSNAEEAMADAHAVLSLRECAEGNEVPIPATDQWVHWPREEDLRFWPHQILRWIRLDESPFELLRLHAKTPLHGWIDAVVAKVARSR